jgi:hypothetical protein
MFYFLFLKIRCIYPSAKVRMYDAEELLNSHDQELMPGHLVEIRKQSGLEGAE